MAASGDTTTLGAQARVMKSGMCGWLRRVKGRTPGVELPSKKYRESFDDEHGSGTFWTSETRRLGG